MRLWKLDHVFCVACVIHFHGISVQFLSILLHTYGYENMLFAFE